MHGLLGVMGNLINGANCTMVMIGLNTPIDPSKLERPPLNLAIAVDTSGSMAGDADRARARGPVAHADALAPEDRVSLVAFSDSAEVVARATAATSARSPPRSTSCSATGATNIYDGLRTAYELVERDFDRERQNRVILLSDGEATAGRAGDRTHRRARPRVRRARHRRVDDRSRQRTSTSPCCAGWPRPAVGTFHFVDDLAAVREIFTEEVNLTVVPIAQRAKLDLAVTDGYELRAIYGTRLAALEFGGATIDLPNAAHRAPRGTRRTWRVAGAAVAV